MHRQSKSVRTIALQLAALALLLNALVPAGFMLHPAGGGMNLTFVLCPDQGALPGYSVAEHHPDVVQSDAGIDTCAFSLLASPMLAGTEPYLATRDVVVEVVLPVRIGVLPQYRRSLTSARGPPVFS